MNRTTPALGALFFLLASACSPNHRSAPDLVDCSLETAYDFENIQNFSGAQTGWFLYSDPTPGGAPNPAPPPPDAGPDAGTNSNVDPFDVPPPGRCGDLRAMKLEMRGKNFWGAGFGEWQHNNEGSRVDGTGWEGISFWARSPINSEKEFLFNVDNRQTIINAPPAPPEGGLPRKVSEPTDDGHQDLDGDGFIGPGDIASGTDCRLPPSGDLGAVPCYNGGVDPPSSAVRVPVANECGNQFHTRITTTETWQLFLIPWKDLVQWPCPNRLPGGIDKTEIAKFEIKFEQGMQYEIWIDNIALYRALPRTRN
jgi:hypothetical protein